MTGWSFEYIDDRMTIPRLEELIGYWSEFPPAHLCANAELGNKRPHEFWEELTDPLAEHEPPKFDGFIMEALGIGIPMKMITPVKNVG